MNSAIIEGLKVAIKTELDGHYFYLMAAESMKDTKGKELFKVLAEEEMSHKKFLEKNYKSLLETGKIDSGASLGKKKIFDGDNPIFSDSIKSRLGDAHFEMTALSIAINLELNSINHYKEQKNLAEDEDVKSFFQELIDWETGHYDALLRQDEAIKHEYWEAAGFAPF